MHYQTLTHSEVEHFIENGWVKVNQAIPRENALAVQNTIWEKLAERGVDKQDRSTWTKPMVHITENYSGPEFDACQTERLTGAMNDLAGADNRLIPTQPPAWGWWPVNFAVGADKAWEVPGGGWHWDGIHFRHYVDAGDQGLLMLPNFSDIGSQGGATVIAEGSHKIVARYLAECPDGCTLNEGITACSLQHPWLAMLTGKAPLPEGESRNSFFMNQQYRDAKGTSLRVVEAVAEAGDVYICHPFLYHAAAPNLSGKPRFMCNRTVPLRRRMRLKGDYPDLSPLEQSVRRALQ